MPLLDQLLGGGVGQFVSGLIDKFHMSPEDKAKFQAAIDANQKEIQLAQLALEAKAQDTLARETEAASANIRAESTSSDKFTSRARPSFVYVMLGIMAANYVLFSLAGKATPVVTD